MLWHGLLSSSSVESEYTGQGLSQCLLKLATAIAHAIRPLRPNFAK